MQVKHHTVPPLGTPNAIDQPQWAENHDLTMAAMSLLGNNTAGQAAPVDLTVAQALALLGLSPAVEPEQTLFYLLNYQPAVTQANDVQLTNALGNIPNRWVATSIQFYMKSATPMTGANQIIRLYEGANKTGQQISGGDFGTIAAGNQPTQTAFEDNAITTAINTGSNQPFYPTSTSQTLYASMSAAGVGGTGVYHIRVRGHVMAFGP